MGTVRTAELKKVTFSATAGSSVSACGTQHLVNLAFVTPETMVTQQDSATVQVCQPTQTPTPTPAPTPTPLPTTPTPTPTPTVTPCQYNTSLPASSPDCKPCDKSISSADSLACVVVHKAASNETQKLPDANNKQAHAGDIIVYTLSAQNTGKSTVKGFVFQESISDVLDYADITDYHGSTKDSNNLLSWPAQDIKAGETVTHLVTVKVKDVIPQTPTSTSDGGHFDLTMTNVYGNTINIPLPGSVTKTVEVVAAQLPNTGPGTSLLIGATLVIVASYFYSRSRLLATEGSIAVQENTSGGW
jgi:uncharacterized repeat protein (TIGR01451 family)